jgi:heme/copper-type cytochrome/quinol oxidase subunit 4
MFSKLIGLAIQAIFFHYVYNLEKNDCKCSVDWRRTFIKYYSVFVLFTILTLIFLSMNKQYKFVQQLLRVILLIISILSIVNLYCLLSYSMHLKEKKCECSANLQRKFMYWYSIIMSGLMIVYIMLLFLFLLYLKVAMK